MGTLARRSHRQTEAAAGIVTLGGVAARAAVLASGCAGKRRLSRFAVCEASSSGTLYPAPVFNLVRLTRDHSARALTRLLISDVSASFSQRTRDIGEK